MPLSKVDICNSALGKMGQDIAIASITENSKAARVFNRMFDRVRDLVLEEHSWPFALTARALEEVLEAPYPGWGYRYAYPSDCISALSVCDADGIRAGLNSYALCGWGEWRTLRWPRAVPFQVTNGAQSTSIATDLEDAYLIFITRVEDTSRYPASFGEALAARLAYDAAPQIMGELGLRAQTTLWQVYRAMLANAAAHGLNEAEEDQPGVTPSVAARG